MAIIEIQNVDVLFGARVNKATQLLDEGYSREQVIERTGVVAAVSDASLCIEPGELCVLMGLSGSGKSSLLRTINRLNPISRGEVTLNLNNERFALNNISAKVLRRLRQNHIAMVFQQFALLPWRSVRDNVGLGLEIRNMPRSQRAPLIEHNLERVGLLRWADYPVDQLSGGMQQRVGLARAFTTQADILLMDEPFSALDPLIRNRLQDELIELQRELKKTIVFVSHDLDEALKLGNRVVIMEEGRIVQSGTPSDIWRAPATQYVKSFVEKMNPLDTLCARDIMQPTTENPTIDQHVSPDTRLRQIVDQYNTEGIIGVHENDRLIGIIKGTTIIDQLRTRS